MRHHWFIGSQSRPNCTNTMNLTYSDSLRDAGTIDPSEIEAALKVVHDHGLLWIDWFRDAKEDGNSPYDMDALASWLGY